MLEDTFKTLSIPLGLIAVIAAVLLFVGLDVNTVFLSVGALAGVPLAVSLLIDVLKYAGAINDGVAGKLSAVLNLIVFAAMAVQMKFYPTFDVIALDAQLLAFVKVAGMVFVYMTGLVSTKQIHYFFAHVVGIKAFSLSGEPF